MAKWTDENTGVFHDTDNLDYGDQGDTRYWDGKPGAVGSVTYDAPKDEGGKPVAVVVNSGATNQPPVAQPLSGGPPVLVTKDGLVPTSGAAVTQPTGTQATGTTTWVTGKTTQVTPTVTGPVTPTYTQVTPVNTASQRTANTQGGSQGDTQGGTQNGDQNGTTKMTLNTEVEKLKDWVQDNPVEAVLGGLVLLMLLGGGGRRRRW